MCPQVNLFQDFLGTIMLRILRWPSIAVLVCAAALVGTAALAQPLDWRDRQLAQWGAGLSDRWSGWYGGVQVGGSFSTQTTSVYYARFNDLTDRFDDTGSSWSGGFNAGYNWRIWNNVVVGVVFDVNGLHDKVRHDLGSDFYVGSTVDFTASAQGRVGLLVTPNTLFYVKGGISVGDHRFQIDRGGPETDERKIVPGGTIGVGSEWKLAMPIILGRSTSVFVDYQHTWWDTVRLDQPIAAPWSNYSWQRQTDKVDVGMRWGF
jgi:hypothetical protein